MSLALCKIYMTLSLEKLQMSALRYVMICAMLHIILGGVYDVKAVKHIAAIRRLDEANSINEMPYSIVVNAAARQHVISSLIYGVAFGTAETVSDLNAPLNRLGGNLASTYNWELNANNHGSDWYFESTHTTGQNLASAPGAYADAFISGSKEGGAAALMTIPLLPYIANLRPGYETLPSFSIQKYGPQTGHDPWHSDAGNGVSLPTGDFVSGNNPLDAYVPSNTTVQKAWIDHLHSTWGNASSGPLKYFLMDNEPSLWYHSHRDAYPKGLTMQDALDLIIDYGSMIKSVDPTAQALGPEEWGWLGYMYSGADQQFAQTNTYNHPNNFPDRAAHGGMDYVPWLLSQLYAYEQNTGQRILDYLSLHYYPQGGEFQGSNNLTMKLLRNRSTRELWDPDYISQSYLNTTVMLLPLMKSWVEQYYPGTKVALTEYNWGDDEGMSGATAQADILGILGREGVDVATRWECPASGTPTYQAFKMYRNYDGSNSTFGDVSLSTNSTANVDDLSSFAALRLSDGALTIMVVNKVLPPSSDAYIELSLIDLPLNLSCTGSSEVWMFSNASFVIERQADLSIERVEANGSLSSSLQIYVPAQSITLLVVPALSSCHWPPSPPNIPSAPAPPFNPTPVFKSNTVMLNSSSTTDSTAAGVLLSGSNVTFLTNITLVSGIFSHGIIDVEVHEGLNNNSLIYQHSWAGVNLPESGFVPMGQYPQIPVTATFIWDWVVTSTPGSYYMVVGTASGDWSVFYLWNSSSFSMQVEAPPPQPPFPPSPPQHPPQPPLPPISPSVVPPAGLVVAPTFSTALTMVVPGEDTMVLSPGETVTFITNVTLLHGFLLNGVVDMEIRNAGNSSQQLYQRYWLGIDMVPDSATNSGLPSPVPQATQASAVVLSFSWSWNASVSPGNYTIITGVFSSGWSTCYLWDTSSTLSVQGADDESSLEPPSRQTLALQPPLSKTYSPPHYVSSSVLPLQPTTYDPSLLAPIPPPTYSLQSTWRSTSAAPSYPPPVYPNTDDVRDSPNRSPRPHATITPHPPLYPASPEATRMAAPSK
ncbi:hypothetical protein CEUSTIGMA_g3900.t1 [Chlamydomonas eustigma]|uniref:Glycoside hydrolase family 44 catalytic domain-containing protein n=1 Tax=Chlamydomonas eustigma TaxID=1157962 RepID=A0A250X075_9CHLO|nr:hypothetical protein CEUSTIGMA_g3900.t1 [Chlamydomonas eustigma]|eukprot:GAX76455.1 hypothetical protein CEUSTIGMA_g3900.t1 [Chlamydomonas eustigma]